MARLIDADELIRQMGWKLGLGDEENGANVDYMEALENCKGLIDNAPTVAFPFEIYGNTCQIERPQGECIECINTNDREYDEGFNAGYAEAIKNIPEYRKLADKLQRPQGEWIELREYDYKCSICGQSMMDKWNYCPDCGADMRGDKE